MRSRRRRRVTPLRVLILLLFVFGLLWVVYGFTDDDTPPRTDLEARPVPPVAVQAPPRRGLAPALRVDAAVSNAGDLSDAATPDAAATMGSDTDPMLADATGDLALTPRPTATPEPAAPAVGDDEVSELLRALNDPDATRMLEPRRRLSALLFSGRLEPGVANTVRDALTAANARLVFSPGAVPGDPITEMIRVAPGDRLGSIGRRFGVPHPLLSFINDVEPTRLRAGQMLKVLRGPVHARVEAGAFVLDTYVEADGQKVFLQSFPVGLGSDGGTPRGAYAVGRDKVINPSWRNPRTGEYFPRDHPEIPIGEYWIPLVGTSGSAATATGIGIHGTHEPESIGREMSMGCIRLGDADIAQVFMMLSEGSRVEVLP